MISLKKKLRQVVLSLGNTFAWYFGCPIGKQTSCYIWGEDFQSHFWNKIIILKFKPLVRFAGTEPEPDEYPVTHAFPLHTWKKEGLWPDKPDEDHLVPQSYSAYQSRLWCWYPGLKWYFKNILSWVLLFLAGLRNRTVLMYAWTLALFSLQE